MIKAVLFDVDGVLIDTLEGNRKTFNRVFEKFGRKPMNTGEYKNFYFVPAKNIYAHFFPEKNEKEIDEMVEYGVSIAPEFFKYDKTYPHVVETLENLKKRSKLGIVTSRVTPLILEFFRIIKYFDTIICLPDVKNHKPHPEPILLALKRLKVRPEEAVYVGDALSDFQAGKAAGVKVIIYRNPEVKGDYNITDFREIPGIIERLNQKS
jgi:phosphoglycolate phosphatase